MKLVALLLAATPVAAQEFVEAPAKLSDDAFYRAVACAAPPGESCRKPLLRWSDARRTDLTVGLVSVADVLQPYQMRLFEQGLAGAVEEINALGAGIRLRRDDKAPDIAIHVVATPPGGVMTGTGIPALDGALLPLGRVALRARDGVITEAMIAVSAKARRREVASVLLEEITQAMGLMTDISGPAYRRSVFSEDGNSVTRLEGQDAMALRRHYGEPGD
ncbi:DUF2927 domain-containing protein [Jannaschia formosa]|uniref:DUF2927 domain-containing protein n=1 Tax=Jannaschia formosa TaxID=2259592 RepID=UPI000E1BE323|nr:DUF2927 domain-containing protein [Jannaschia formosa]TFL17684.1 DUF2927 domain-containing protein [Jannaschia formosa]